MDVVTASRPTRCGCTVGIAGFGTVGRAVARILADGSHPGLRLTHVCNRDVARKRVDWAGPDVVWTDSFQALVDSPVDVIVELVGGQDPARGWIEQALAAGKSVVTANKQVIAHGGPALLREAGRRGRHLLFEAAVAGGIPILRGLREGVAGDRLRRIQGILNGTCNYVLTRMESAGLSFRDALAEAQRLGYAEADPTDDVDGHDAGAKLAILAGVGLGHVVRVDDIPVDRSPRSPPSTSPTRAGWDASSGRWRGPSCFPTGAASTRRCGRLWSRRRRRWGGSRAAVTSWSSTGSSGERPRSPGSGPAASRPRSPSSRT